MNIGARVRAFKAVAERENEEGSVSGNAGPTVVLGGRSMGARAAVIAATEIMEEKEDKEMDEGAVRKVLMLVSYPLRNEKGDIRDEILLGIPESWDVIFISGERDTMCDAEELREVRGRMKCNSWFVIVRGANHGMEVKPKRGTEDIGKMTGTVAARWLGERDKGKTQMEIYWDDDDEQVRCSEWHTPEEGALGETEGKTPKSNPKKLSKANGKADAKKSTKTSKKKSLHIAEDEEEGDEGAEKEDVGVTSEPTRKRKSASASKIKRQKVGKKDTTKLPQKRRPEASDAENVSSRTRQRRKL